MLVQEPPESRREMVPGAHRTGRWWPLAPRADARSHATQNHRADAPSEISRPASAQPADTSCGGVRVAEPSDHAPEMVADAAPLGDHERTAQGGRAGPAPASPTRGKWAAWRAELMMLPWSPVRWPASSRAFDELRGCRRGCRARHRADAGRAVRGERRVLRRSRPRGRPGPGGLGPDRQKLDTYDPSVGRFVHFARYWARMMVRRYRDTPVGRGVETPLSAMLGGVLTPRVTTRCRSAGPAGSARQRRRADRGSRRRGRLRRDVVADVLDE